MNNSLFLGIFTFHTGLFFEKKGEIDVSLRQEMKGFNTSGLNLSGRHYTLNRENLIAAGMLLVRNERYFTIWAPRQTGKSTFFQLLGEKAQVRPRKQKPSTRCRVSYLSHTL